MLEYLFGSISTERVLMFLTARDEGYAREIARFYGTEFNSIHRQLVKLEFGGVIISRTAGSTRLYRFNPRYPFLKELKGFLEKVLSFYPEDERERLVMVRRRPRRGGKQL